MKHIIKSTAPKSLTRHSQRHNADFDNYVDKNKLRDALLDEQGQICCYCMQRISKNESKIEHWASQADHQELQLEYSNLLAACPGGEGSPQHLHHCDTSKGDADITINPTDHAHNCERLIRYGLDGKIYSDLSDVNTDLDSTLNLNLQTITNNRKAVLDGAIEALRRSRPDGRWTRAYLQREKNKLLSRNQDGNLSPFCGIVIVYLDKKLSQL